MTRSLDELSKNAKINGELISKICQSIIMMPDIGSEIQIVLTFYGTNLDLEHINKEMGLYNTGAIIIGKQE